MHTGGLYPKTFITAQQKPPYPYPVLIFADAIKMNSVKSTVGQPGFCKKMLTHF